MKKSSVLILALAVLFFAGCGAGFLLDTGDLKGKTFTYIIDGNGMDSETFTFDNTGKAGSWEQVEYTFGFATEAAETSGKYTDKSWYQTYGERGTFTYDEATHVITITVTETFYLKADATTSYAADYGWMTNLLFFQTYMIDPSVTVIVETRQKTFVPNSDFGFYRRVYAKDGDSWSKIDNLNYTYTMGGTDYISTYNYKDSLTISGTTVYWETVENFYNKDGNDEPATQTTIETYTEDVTNCFIVGQETTDKMTFETIWKEGNSVTVWTEQAEYQRILYHGTTAPSTAPTVDPTTGIGTSSGTDPDWTWDIDRADRSPWSYTFIHNGDSIMLSTDYIAGRGL